jgi:glycosyltransferase involved in cell wall biosynthesis
MLPHSAGLFMPGPKVSIIVPVYTGASYICDAIDNALAQTWSDIEIVVVNDGSRDDGATEAIALSFRERIRYLRTKPNGGVAFARNAGVAAMTGEVFCWCGHDDTHLPEKTAAAVREESESRRNRKAATCAAGGNHHRRTRRGKGVGPPGLTDVAANWKTP